MKIFGITRLFKAMIYSIQGLKSAFHHEEAFRLEFFLAFILIPLTFFFDLNGVEHSLLVASVLWVMIIELVNSAIEAVVDRVGTEWNELAKRAKDIGSAAVLLSVLLAMFIWLKILL